MGVGIPVPQGLWIDEFSSHGSTSQFPSSTRSLNIPRKVPPEPSWEQDLNKWAVVSNYLSGRTDAAALQAAIDDQTKTSVAIDRELDLGQTVYVRNNIKLIIGTNAYLRGSGLEVTDGSAPVVKIRNMNGSSTITQRSSRPLILESVLCSAIGDGSGDLFLTDHVAGMDIRNSRQNVWAWHFNSEGGGIRLSAGTIRCFGWKTEHDGTKVTATGGTLEMLGFLMYCPCGAKTTPLLNIANTEFSLAMMNQFTFCDGALYDHLVHETQGATTRDLYVADNKTAYDLPLYLSHNRLPLAAAEAPHARVDAINRGESRRMLALDKTGYAAKSVPNRGVYDLRGRQVRAPAGRRASVAGRATPEGVYFLRGAK